MLKSRKANGTDKCPIVGYAPHPNPLVGAAMEVLECGHMMWPIESMISGQYGAKRRRCKECGGHGHQV